MKLTSRGTQWISMCFRQKLHFLLCGMEMVISVSLREVGIRGDITVESPLQSLHRWAMASISCLPFHSSTPGPLGEDFEEVFGAIWVGK